MALTTTEKPKNDESQALIIDQLVTYAYHFFWVIDVLVVVLIFITSFFFILKPKYQEITSEKEIWQKRAEIDEKSKYYDDLKNLRSIFEGIKETDKEKVRQIVSNPNDRNDLYREIQYLILSVGMTPASIEPQPMDVNFIPPNLSGNQKGGPLLGRRQTVKTTIQITNVRYESLLAFLRRMEVNLRLMDVVKVEYKPMAKTAQVEVLTYQQQ